MRRLILLSPLLFALPGCSDTGFSFGAWPGDSFPVALTDANIQAAGAVICRHGADYGETKTVSTYGGDGLRVTPLTCKAP